MRAWECEIPLPPRSVSPNRKSSEHWSKRHKAVKEYKGACYFLFISAKLDGRLPFGWGGKVTISADFYMAPNPYDGCVRPRDEDNAQGCLKPAIDALVEADVIRGDSAKYVHTGRVRLFSKAKDHKGRHCVVIRITEALAAVEGE